VRRGRGWRLAVFGVALVLVSAGLLGTVGRHGRVAIPAATTVSSTFSDALANNATWSGYVDTGGPVRGITGTFTVPSLTAPLQAGSNFSEWVGLDGYGNSSLIQAGVDEYPDPGVAGLVDVMPWWEILPSPETPATSFVNAVSPGDSITIVIDLVSGTLWQVALTDNSTGDSYITEQPYTGPAGTAEWIIEAPLDGSTGRTYPLAPYSPSTFSGISVEGPTSPETGLVMDQNDADVSWPSSLVPGGTSFNMAYGSSAPDAP
jgi:hypothetical protein